MDKSNEMEKRAVATDFELYEGVFPIGHVVHLWCARYAYRGILKAVTPSYYVLSDAVMVFETGDLSEYEKTRKGSYEEKSIGSKKLVERLSVESIDIWD